MGWMDEYNKALKKYKKKEEEQVTQSTNTSKTTATTSKTTASTSKSSSKWMQEYERALPKYQAQEAEKQKVADKITVGRLTSSQEEEEEKKWYDGYLKNGSNEGVAKSILGTIADATEDWSAGFLGYGEKAIDSIASFVPKLSKAMYIANGGGVGYTPEADKLFEEQNKAAQKEIDTWAAKDLYDEQAVARQLLSNLYGNAQNIQKMQGGQMLTTDDLAMGQENTKYAKQYMDTEMESDSYFDEKLDANINSLGNVSAIAALAALGIPADVGIFLSAHGAEYENALKNGATSEEAAASALISGGAEVIFSKLSGGVKLPGSGTTLDEGLTKLISRKVSNKAVRNLLNTGMDVVGEGLEEYFTGYASAIGQKLTYLSDKELKEIYSSEDKLDSFIGGALLGGFGNLAQQVEANATGRDVVTGFTENEQKVVDKLYKEWQTEDMTESEKSKLYDDVVRGMDRGTIDAETIAEILDGDSHKAYESLVKESEEFKTLYETPYEKLSAQQNDRLKELQSKHEAKKYEDALSEAKTKRFTDTWDLVRGTRLEESFRDALRKNEDFQADFDSFKGSKHEEAARKTLQSAMDFVDADGKHINNSTAIHDVVDLAAKISSETGKVFTFTDGESIKQSFIKNMNGKIAELEQMQNRTEEDNNRLAEMKDILQKVESGEVTVNGDTSGDNITINLDSEEPLKRTVGHEVTHKLEMAKVYDKLKEALTGYAKAKGIDIDKELSTRKAKYAGIENADPERELIADLVGDYIFSDYDFVTHLSANHRNVFQKVYDEIKHLCKLATAGSKAARELEQAKRQFEKAYQEASESSSETGDTQYSLSDNQGRQLSKSQVEYFKDSQVRDENGNLVTVYHTSPTAGFYTFDGGKGEGNYKYGGYDAVVTFFTDNREMSSSYAKNPEMVDTRRRGKIADAVQNLKRSAKTARGKTTSGQYDGYINITNPLVVDAKGRLWNEIPHGEANNRFSSVTEKEKAALMELHNECFKNISWVDPSTFAAAADEFTAKLEALEQESTLEGLDARDAEIASAIKKIGDVDLLAEFVGNNFADKFVERHTAVTTNDIVREALAAGTYDGVIIKNVLDYANYNPRADQTPGNVYVTFGAEQFKAWDNTTPTRSKDMRYSLSDSDGKKLSKAQQDYFKDSKMRDENGNLKVMYHGSQDAGFHVFDSSMSDDDTSFFFVDRNDVAATYSGTSETYEARTIRTAEDMNNFLAEIGYDHYQAVERNGKFELLENNEHVATKDTAQEIYEEFCWYEGVGDGDANYKVYLNLKNPLEVDAEGRNWDMVGREFSQEVYDIYQTLTEAEKEQLTQLAAWEDIGIFRDELNKAAELFDMGRGGDYIENLASAFGKLFESGTEVSMYDLFDIAADNFSEESLRNFAVKQLTTRDYAQKAKAEGYDGVIFKNIVDIGGYGNGSEGTATVAIAFDSNQIKSVANESPTEDKDIRYSLSDNSYLDAVNRGDTDTAQRMVEDAAKNAGYAVHAYHGTARGDRVGNVFLPERATSGPMAFFTDNREIAENYSKSKQDTSMAYDPDYDRYETQFRIKTKYQDMPLYKAWGYLPFTARNKITKKAGQLRENWDGDNELMLDPDTNEANGGFQWQLKEARGNAIQALTEQWLNSGNLFNEESRFLDVLEMAGVTEEFRKIGMDSLYFKDPNAKHEKVYDTFLKINNPFDTSTVTEQFADDLESWYEEQDQEQYAAENMESDMWDKHGIDAYDFAERLRSDIENNTTHAWTSIPDSVTDYLKSLGYDGIKDSGGKFTLEWHTVWIPFSSEQVKSAEAVAYDDSGNVIPLSKRFNPDKTDIRYSLTEKGEAPFNRSINDVYGKDAKVQNPFDIAPIVDESVRQPSKPWTIDEMFPDEETPETELDYLVQEKESLESYMLEMGNTGDWSDFEAINERYIEVSTRMAELENEISEAESGRVDSLEYEDAPPEIDAPYYESEHDPTVLTKKATADIVRDVRANLGVPNAKVSALKDIIESYRNGEIQSREELFDALQDQFGTYKESTVTDEMVKDAQKFLRRYALDITPEVLSNFTDFYVKETGFKARNKYKLLLRKGGSDISSVYQEANSQWPSLFPYEGMKGENRVPQQLEIMEQVANMTGGITETRRKDAENIYEAADIIISGISNFRMNQEQTFAERQAKGAFADLVKNVAKYAPEIAPEPVSQPNQTTPTKTAPEKVGAQKSTEKVAEVLTKASKPDKKSGFGMGVISQAVDKGMAVENLAYKTGNEELQPKYHMAQHSTTAAAAQYFMENGADGVKPYNDVVREIQKSGKQHDFELYMYHALNTDRMSLKQRFGLDNMAVFGNSITADASRAEVAKYEAENPEFKAWANDIYSNLRYMRNMLVKGNLASQETADWWEVKYPHYVPITRKDAKGANVFVPLDTNKTGVNAPIKRAVGGNSDIEPMLNTIAQRIEQTYSAIGRNAFGIELKNTLRSEIEAEIEEIGILPNGSIVKAADRANYGKITSYNESTGKYAVHFVSPSGHAATVQLDAKMLTPIKIAEVDEMIDTLEDQDSKLLKPGTAKSNPTFTVFENGKRVEFEITEDLYNSLKPAGEVLGHRFENSDKAVVRGVGKVLNARRNLLTNWNPVFAWYRNPAKDLQDVAINSQHALRTYLNIPNAIIQYAKNGKYATEYHQHGGKGNTFYDSRTNEFVEKNMAQKLLGMYEVPGEFIEEIPRLAEYIASRQEGRSIERSMLDAARVTTNFAAGGDFTKFLNTHGFTFLNASVQGASQHVRNFRESYHNQGAMGVAKTLAKYVIAGIPTIVFNGLIWDDDEEYEELNDYVKQNYWIIDKTDDGKFVRIPKGRTAAVMGELAQQMVNLVTGDDEVDLSTFNELFWNNIAPSNPLENNILAPVVQTLNNEAWYGGDLVPSRLQDLPAEEQYDESTDILSKWIGEKTGTSPYKWNYLIDQYSGGLGDVFLPMMTPEAESGDNSFMGNILAPWKKELTTDSVLNNKYPGDFYELRDDLEVVANGKNATEEDTMRSMYMDSVSWEMSDLYKQKREVQNSALSDSRKYEKVREIQEQINALAENALNSYDDIHIDGYYATVGDKRFDYSDYSGKWYEIEGEYLEKEQNAIKRYGITPSEYWNDTDLYYWADRYFDDKYATNNREYIANTVFGGKRFAPYAAELGQIRGEDKDGDGKTDSGTKKNNIIEYINGLDIEYGEKIIMYRTLYSSKADREAYNMEIIEYLNSRDDIDYQEMKTILEELGMEVDSNGKITWD